MIRGFIQLNGRVKRFVGVSDGQQCGNDSDNPKHPCQDFPDELAFVPFPDGVELHTEQLGDKLHIGAFPVEPRPTVDLLVNVGPEDFGESQFVNNWVEAFRFRVAAVGDAVNDEKMDVVGAAKVVEELDFLAYPFRFG